MAIHQTLVGHVASTATTVEGGQNRSPMRISRRKLGIADPLFLVNEFHDRLSTCRGLTCLLPKSRPSWQGHLISG